MTHSGPSLAALLLFGIPWGCPTDDSFAVIGEPGLRKDLPPHMKASIRIVNGPLAGQTVEVGTRLLVGRETDCDLRPVGEFVSRHHCALALDGFTLRILDLGSKNGTFVNGHRIAAGSAILLHDADLVSVGETTFIIELSPQPDEAGNQRTPSSAELKGTGLFDSRTVENGVAAPPSPADKPQEGQRPLA